LKIFAKVVLLFENLEKNKSKAWLNIDNKKLPLWPGLIMVSVGY